MKIISSSLYNEVNSYFSISHNVDLKIREELNDSILLDLQLDLKEKEMDYINLSVSTNRDTIDVLVKGPDINQKEKIINWGLWLPYEPIVTSEDQVIPYLRYYFEAIAILFSKYGIPEKRINEIRVRIESEIIGNKKYDYESDDINYDFSDLDFT